MPILSRWMTISLCIETFSKLYIMTAALINLIFPLLFIVSIGVLLYSIGLFVLSLVRKSRPLRTRSFKVAILPLLYIVGTLSLFRFLSWNYNRKMMPKISGRYEYSFNDTFQLVYQLRSDNTYSIKSPRTTASGTWAIATNTYLITFYDQDKKEMTRSQFKSTPTKSALLFLNNKDTIELVKQE
jgi:hypothetical protein